MRQPSGQTPEPAPGQLVSVTSEFHSKSRRPGGLKREVGLQKAETMLISAHAEIRDEFESTFEMTMQLAEKLKENAASTQDIHQLRKSARHLRDVGTLAQYPLITSIAAMLVDYLNRCMTDPAIGYRMDVFTCLTDTLLMAKSQAFRGVKADEAPKLMADLSKMMTSIGAD